VSRFIATGSGIERHMNCHAAAVLPRAWSESSPYAARGTAIHDHLYRVAQGEPEEESLTKVDPEHRDAAASVDLANLEEDLKLSPEVALAYCPADDTARPIGQGLARDYSSVRPDEIPLTIDLAGRIGDHGVVRDYKTGNRNVTRAGINWQLIGAALAVSRAFDLDEVEAEIIYVRPRQPVFRDTGYLTGLELAGYAADLRASMDRVKRDRERYKAGEHIEPTEGSWCQYCPSKWACPAKVGTLRMGLGIAAGQTPIPAGDLVKARELVRDARLALQALEKQIDASLTDPVLVSVNPDGTGNYYGAHQADGNEVIDPDIAVAAAVDVLGIDAAKARAALVKTSVTKKAIEDLAASKAPHGAVAATVRRLTAAIADAGGVSRPTITKIGAFTQRVVEIAR
jgi:hypothetical protein